MAKSAATVVKSVKNARLWSDGTITIEGVRGSYVHAFKPYAGDDGGTAKYSIVCLLPKDTHGEAKNLIKDEVEKLRLSAKLGDLADDKKCLRNGDTMGKAECKGMFVVSAREERKPLVLMMEDGVVRKADPEGDKDKFYGGAWFDVLIRLWPQSNKYGKRVNAGLNVIKFLRDDEAFGEGRISDEEAASRFGASGGYDDGLGDTKPAQDDDDL